MLGFSTGNAEVLTLIGRDGSNSDPNYIYLATQILNPGKRSNDRGLLTRPQPHHWLARI
jgi:hypothetical protein